MISSCVEFQLSMGLIGLSSLSFADLRQKVKLNLLYLGQAVPLMGQEMIDLVMKVPDFELRLEVHLIVMLRAETILRFQAILAHHDDRRLYGRETGQNKIQEDVRIGSGGRKTRTNVFIPIHSAMNAPKRMRNAQLPPKVAIRSASLSPKDHF